MHKDYLVVFNLFDDKVQRAIRDISAKPNAVMLDQFMRIFEEVTKAPSLTMIINSSDERISPDGRADFLRSPTARDAVIYPIEDDGTVNFKDAIYGANVDSRYL